MTRIFMKLGENHVGLFSQGKTTLPKRDSATSYPRHSFQVPEGEYDAMAAKIRRAMFLRARHRKRTRLGLFLEARPGLPGLGGKLRRDHQSERHQQNPAASPSLRHDGSWMPASIFTGNFSIAPLKSKGRYAAVTVPSGQCVVLNQVSELSEVTKTTYRGRHFAFNVTRRQFSRDRRQAPCGGHRRARRPRRARRTTPGAVGHLLQRAERVSPADHQRKLGGVRAPRERLADG